MAELGQIFRRRSLIRYRMEAGGGDELDRLDNQIWRCVVANSKRRWGGGHAEDIQTARPILRYHGGGLGLNVLTGITGRKF